MVNLTALSDLINAIVGMQDSLINLIILGVVLAIAVYLGVWIKDVLEKSIPK